MQYIFRAVSSSKTLRYIYICFQQIEDFKIIKKQCKLVEIVLKTN